MGVDISLSLGSLLDLEAEEVGFRAAWCFGIVAVGFVEGFTALVKRIYQ